ncbi:hypothetical protein HDU93_003913 [Gonapodya sp. JEL0774]|nr:hypothetical protein HDU93_003913 [Gonapodya sp. JEL0774]
MFPSNPSEIIPLHPYNAPDVLEFSPDGTTLAAAFSQTASSSGALGEGGGGRAGCDILLIRQQSNQQHQHWNPQHCLHTELQQSRTPTTAIPAASRFLSALAWSPDSTALFAAYFTGEFRSWSLPPSFPITVPVPGPDLALPDDSFTSIAVSSDLDPSSPSRTSLIALGTARSGVRLLWIASQPSDPITPLRALRAETLSFTLPLSDPTAPELALTNQPRVTAVAWCPTAPYPTLAAALADGRIALWELRSTPSSRHFDQNPQSLTLVSPNLNPFSHTPLQPNLLYCLWLSTHTDPSQIRLRWSPLGTYLATTGSDRRVSIWTPHRDGDAKDSSAVNRNPPTTPAGHCSPISWRRHWSGFGTDCVFVTTPSSMTTLCAVVSGSSLVTVSLPADPLPRSLFSASIVESSNTLPSWMSQSTASPTANLTPLLLPTPPTCIAAHPTHPSIALPSSVSGGFGSHSGMAGFIAAFVASDVAQSMREDDMMAGLMDARGGLHLDSESEHHAGGADVAAYAMAFGSTAWSGVYAGSGRASAKPPARAITGTTGLPGYGVWTPTANNVTSDLNRSAFTSIGVQVAGLSSASVFSTGAMRDEEGIRSLVGAVGGLRIG